MSLARACRGEMRLRSAGSRSGGIGIVIARLIEAVLREEELVVPVGSHDKEHGVPFSLPSLIGRTGVEGVLTPRLDAQEQDALAGSIATLQHLLAGSRTPATQSRERRGDASWSTFASCAAHA